MCILICRNVFCNPEWIPAYGPQIHTQLPFIFVISRLLKYDPVTNNTEVLYKKLYFANGVQLSKDNSYLLVSETTKSRILK